MLQHHRHACASVSLPSYLCEDTWGGSGWVRKLAWLSDACVSLSAFTGKLYIAMKIMLLILPCFTPANPSLSAIFPSYHGFVHIYSLPAPSALIPASDKFSSLRGLSSSGENNLAFKCMRKRLVFETLHLDLEGGVSERRTTPTPNSIETIVPSNHDHATGDPHVHGATSSNKTGLAAVEVQLEHVKINVTGEERSAEIPMESTATSTKKKPKKRVAFTSDRPDLYDF